MAFSESFQIVIQLFLAVILGSLIGLERELKRKEAGLQTYSLVVLGACLFTVISFQLFDSFFGKAGINFDPSIVIQAIAVGIGFIGAGVISGNPLEQ
jgi:putative Mg2+ transporter-C (MgtC) family protein